MTLLVEFLLRLVFGLAAAMTLAPPSQVTSGYYRNHLYVLLGLSVLAAVVLFSRPELGSPWLAAAAATASYLGAVVWLYEKPVAGVVMLGTVAALGLAGMVQHALAAEPATIWTPLVDGPTSGAVLGTTLAAMFLGHWYLNTPTMRIAPLRRLVAAMGAAVVLRMAFCGTMLGLELLGGWPGGFWTWFLVLRWLAGLVGTLVVVVMTWQVLKIPNTQSATGILYVGVITTFLGELASMLAAQHFMWAR